MRGVGVRRGRLWTTSLVAAIAALLLLGAAGPPLSGGGTGEIVIDPEGFTNIRAAGGNLIQERELSGTIEGTLDGTFEEEATGTIHRTGLITFRAELVFTGTIEGCGPDEHTLVLTLSGQGHATPQGPITEASVRLVGDERNTVQATGQGTVWQAPSETEPGVSELTYELQYRC